MFKCRNRETCILVARERGLSWVGWSVFGGDWYAASTADQLIKAGVHTPERI